MMSEDYAIKTIDPKSAEGSLVLPQGKMAIYRHDNWKWSEIEEGNHGVHKLTVQCLEPGFEDLNYRWDVTDHDISHFGEGNINAAFEYFRTSFCNTLDNKKEQYISQIKNAGGLLG